MKASAHERQALTNLLTRTNKKEKKATYTPKNTLWFTVRLPRTSQRNHNRVYFNTSSQSRLNIVLCTGAGRLLSVIPPTPICCGTEAPTAPTLGPSAAPRRAGASRRAARSLPRTPQQESQAATRYKSEVGAAHDRKPGVARRDYQNKN